MLPSAYEFNWDTGHILFLGIFYGVVVAVLSGLGIAAYRWWGDLRQKRGNAIAWEETFHDLPQSRRHCRHEFSGTVFYRICDHGFDCGTCTQHPELATAKVIAGAVPPPPVGLRLPPQRLYHRGHTWVEPLADGTLAVGLDDFAKRCFGQPDHISLPQDGTDLQTGEPAVTLKRGHWQARVCSPVAGKVLEPLGPDDQWLFRVQPTDPAFRMDNLLKGDEARVWMMRELEWIQRILSSQSGIPTLADGGTPVDDFVAAYPQADWDNIWAQVCLDG